MPGNTREVTEITKNWLKKQKNFKDKKEVKEKKMPSTT